MYKYGQGTESPGQRCFRTFVRRLLAEGIKPTPKTIYELQEAEGYKFVYYYAQPYFAFADRTYQLGTPYQHIRIEEFQRAGWTMDRKSWKWRAPGHDLALSV